MPTLIYTTHTNYFSIKTLGIVLLLLFSSFKIIAQDCAKVDKTDEFTKARTVETNRARVYGASVASLALTNSPDWGYYVFFTLKNNELFFSLSDEGQYHSTSVFDSISLKLSNDTIITLKNFQSDGAYEGFNNYDYEKSHSKIGKKALDMLMEFNITYIKFNISINTLQTKVDKSTGDKIKKAANCISTYLPASFVTQSANIDLQGQIVEKNSTLPQPTNDTTSVTLYKQWKLMASLDSTGIPMDMSTTTFMQFNSNGTYKTTLVLKDGKVFVSNGKFQLLNDSKLIVFTLDTNGKSSNAAITKFTKTEIVFKNQKYQSIYVAY
jgi:hypothetical protein